MSSATKPFANCYWVVANRLLAGEHPGSDDIAATRERIDALLAAGIDSFVDLTAPDEREPYDGLLPTRIDYARLPIRDHGLPESERHMEQIQSHLIESLARGRRVYVHCRAGIGRTGMVVGCYLAGSGDAGDRALDRLNELWGQCARSSSWLVVPETPEQTEFVRSWVPRAEATSLLAAPAVPDVQFAAAQELRERFHGAMLGLAVGDALAAATQFGKPGKFAPVSDLLGGGPYDLPRGAWSDDTAMALCLAESLLEAGGFDARDQMDRYARWKQTGHLSATGECVGITASVARAISAAQWRRQPFAGSHDPRALEKDPLVRVAPVVLFYFGKLDQAVAQSAQSARTTAQAPELLAACQLFAAMLHAALSGGSKADILGPPVAQWQGRTGVSPRLRALASQFRQVEPTAELNPAGDALDALQAAVSAFAAGEDYRSCVLRAVNLGGDSDVIGSLCGQLAGAHYGVTGIAAGWRASLSRHDLIEDIADRLLAQALIDLADKS